MQSDNEPSGRTFIEEARRAQILTATAEVVANEGYSRASLSRIATQAGVSKGVVTYHFTNKNEILTDMVRDYYGRGWEYMEARIAAEPTAVGQVNAWVSSQIEFFTTSPTEFFAMSSIVDNLRDEDGTTHFADDDHEATEAMAEILRAGQQEGQLRDFNAEKVANVILSSVDGVLGSWALSMAPDRTTDLTEHIEALKDFIAHAIRKVPS
ncbi:MAG: TetR/AcrR family transcriptional regulator [Mycobacteriaceae bacterium]